MNIFCDCLIQVLPIHHISYINQNKLQNRYIFQIQNK